MDNQLVLGMERNISPMQYIFFYGIEPKIFVENVCFYSFKHLLLTDYCLNACNSKNRKTLFFIEQTLGIIHSTPSIRQGGH